MSTARSVRAYEVVVFGATGFTGNKTAEYLARHAPKTLAWAIAGRSAQKLAEVKARLVSIDPVWEKVGVLQASVDDAASLSAMAAQTRVVLTTVGPFIDYGEPLVKACIAEGTDYVDSTGEPFFVQMLQARYADAAARANVRLVPSCGFDSIPADLGVLFTVQQFPPGAKVSISGYIKLKATFSGGTEQSAIKSFVPPKDAVTPPPPVASNGRRVRLVTSKVKRLPELGGWSAPLPTIDGPVVLRSAASLDRYGPDFSYSHNVIHVSALALLVAGLVFGSLAVLVQVSFIRNLLLKLVKKSGEGPSDEQMEKSWFSLSFIAESDGKTIRTEVRGGDPGYGETSKMLAESAMCLALDSWRLPERAGLLTPAEAMGDVLIARLKGAGLQFNVLEK